MPLLLPCPGFPFSRVVWSLIRGSQLARADRITTRRKHALLIEALKLWSLEQTTLLAKRYSLMDVASNHYYVLSLEAINLSK
jgi:hypothetical protein